ILDLAVNENIVIKSGAWFSYNEAKIGQGRENAKQYLRDNPTVMAEVEQKVRAHFGIGDAPDANPANAETAAAATAEEKPARGRGRAAKAAESAPKAEDSTEAAIPAEDAGKQGDDNAESEA
ncbi:MAG: DNA recombination/repair protein RecA, partial [Lachnospiraceae bacterium]|nr:DNA recombination/repair protein RecA [Lachnospiraceae bacterium]